MSNNPRGRPTKSVQDKKRVKKAADHKRYLHSKLNSDRILAPSTSKENNTASTSISDEQVSSIFIYIAISEATFLLTFIYR